MSSPPATSPPATAGPAAARPAPADLLPLLTAAVRAVLTLLVPIAVLTLVAWLGAVRSTSSLAAVVRVGADVWLLGHGAPVAVVGGSLAVAPLGVTLLALASAVRAVRTWVRDQVEAERGVPFWPGAGVFAAGYGVLALLLALVTRSGVSAAAPVQALLGGALVGGLGFLAGARAHRPPLPPRVPAALAAALRPAAASAAALVALGSLAVAVALVHGRSDVLLLHRSLEPGLLGGALLVLAQALLLPTLAVWGLAWLAGPGFAVGTATSVAPGGTTLATLPAVPVLGALPPQGPAPVAAWAVVLLPVLVGAGAALLRRPRAGEPAGPLHRVAVALLTGALAGLVSGVLAAAASGPLGSGRMGEMGPHAAWTALAVAGEVAAGGVAAVLLQRAWTAWRGTRVASDLPAALSERTGGLLAPPGSAAGPAGRSRRPAGGSTGAAGSGRDGGGSGGPVRGRG
ncbi:cell division protein PerM [Kineococcus sp. SYSU DK005]|uniref:cell division protein PerM n=1 Tax=Kineococcus sp. SYSU DK005 TaxID=3383126 RepID=UPI003D7D337D